MHQYINRADKNDLFESDVTSWLEKENVSILGFPGVGKSATAKAIAAKYIRQHHNDSPSVIMSISPTKKPDHRIEIVNDDRVSIPVPIVSDCD